MPPKFIYFDLGRVILNFDVAQMCRQVAEATGVEPAVVMQTVIEGPLQRDFETGRLSPREFHEEFCRLTETCAEYDLFTRAGSDIFTVNTSMLPVVAGIQAAGYRTGVLSNTCQTHWEHCLRQFRILQGFPVRALSYEIGAMKPDPAIYQAAAELAGVEPHEVFFTDDLAENVAGAREAGFDAVQYTSTPELVRELQGRGVRFNY
ncbi:MAG: HAD family phosphatase [Thermoguttaceae bacterium]|nr:HAD family phosphatase [Thermoguttaceae bacterium]